MDDLKKKAIATAAKEILKRPYSQVSSGISLDSWPLRDRISSAVACCVAGGGTTFAIWLWGPWRIGIAGPWFSWYWILIAAVLMAVLGFMQPGWTESFLGLTRQNKENKE
jgi:hypothetical protein